MVKQHKLFKILPYIVFSAIISYSWCKLLLNDYIPTVKHILALLLVMVNLGAYFWNYKKGLILTGVLLVIASFSLIALSVEIVSYSAFIKMGGLKVTFPSLNYLALGLFLFYCVVNFEIVRDALKRIAKLF